MERQEIETRLLSEGIRFFPEPPLFDFVSLGEEVRYSPICAPREVGLLLQIISGRSINPAKLLVTKEPAPNVTRAPLPSEIDHLPERMFALYPVRPEPPSRKIGLYARRSFIHQILALRAFPTLRYPHVILWLSTWSSETLKVISTSPHSRVRAMIRLGTLFLLVVLALAPRWRPARPACTGSRSRYAMRSPRATGPFRRASAECYRLLERS
jgi:hypothetical protein